MQFRAKSRTLASVPQALGSYFRVQPCGVGSLAEEIDGKGNFTEVLQAVRTAVCNVFRHLGGLSRGEHPQQKQLVVIL